MGPLPKFGRVVYAGHVWRSLSECRGGWRCGWCGRNGWAGRYVGGGVFVCLDAAACEHRAVMAVA